MTNAAAIENIYFAQSSVRIVDSNSLDYMDEVHSLFILANLLEAEKKF